MYEVGTAKDKDVDSQKMVWSIFFADVVKFIFQCLDVVLKVLGLVLVSIWEVWVSFVDCV